MNINSSSLFMLTFGFSFSASIAYHIKCVYMSHVLFDTNYKPYMIKFLMHNINKATHPFNSSFTIYGVIILSREDVKRIFASLSP